MEVKKAVPAQSTYQNQPDSQTEVTAQIGAHSVTITKAATNLLPTSTPTDNEPKDEQVKSKHVVQHPPATEASQQPADALSSKEIQECRETIASSALRLAHIYANHVPGYPIVLGSFATQCLQLSSQLAQDGFLRMSNMDLNHNITIVAGSVEQKEKIETLCATILRTNPKVKREITVNNDEDKTIHFSSEQGLDMKIEIRSPSPLTATLHSQPCTLLPCASKQPITVRVSQVNNSELTEIHRQISSPCITYAGLQNISYRLGLINPETISEADIFLYSAILACYRACCTRFAVGDYTVVLPQKNPAQTTVQPVSSEAAEPLSMTELTPASPPVFTTQQSVEAIIDSPTLCQSLYNLKRDTLEGIDLSYKKIAEAFSPPKKSQ